MKCDFTGQDLKSILTDGSNCGSLCWQTTDCTHFAFNSYNGGTCWLKSGSVTYADAVVSDDESSSCGIIYESSATTNSVSTSTSSRSTNVINITTSNTPTTGSALCKYLFSSLLF